MCQYSLWQWILIFYFYGFLGWCWESSYVSAKQKKLENRGFLKGPFLIIYAFSNLVFILSAAPVMEYPVLVFLFGAASTSILELITGYVFDTFFGIRFWDYSSHKINYRGYVSLSYSIIWGFFSLAVNYIMQGYVGAAICSLSDKSGSSIVIFLTVITVADLVAGFENSFSCLTGRHHTV